MQIAWPGDLVLIDPLAVSLRPLAEVLEGPGVAVMHASGQDLEVLQQECGTIPSAMFDTQVAAGFAGFGTPSLGTLVERTVGVRLPKGDRLADWLRRPIDADQLEYAASDVRYLLDVQEHLRATLTESGRLGWAEAECEELRRRSVARRDPDEAWWRIKEARQLRGKARGVAQAVAAWRERRAAQIDQPVRFVLPDLALVGIAQRPPRTLADLRVVRGLDERHVRKPAGTELLEAVQAGMALTDEEIRTPAVSEVDRDLRPAVTLVSAWVSQLARDLRIDTALLATRADIEGVIRGDTTGRLSEGWRAEAVGDAIKRLVDGRAAVAFDGHGNLVLEDR